MKNTEGDELSSSVNEGVLEIVVSGAITENTYENVVNEVNAIIKANHTSKAIANFRAVNKRVEPSELYRYFRNYNAVLFEIKYAIVDLPENAPYKTAAKNAGLSSLMWFTDMDDARQWIKKND